MAEKKTKQQQPARKSAESAPRKTAPKTTQKKKSSTAKAPPKHTASKSMSVEAIRQRNQIRAVVLFACAIFSGCLVLIPGDNLWLWAHNVVLGLFGGWAVLWPFLMLYVAIVTTLEKPRGSISGKIWLSALIILLFCGTGYIFSAQPPAHGTKLTAFLVTLYRDNSGVSGGVFGGMIGLPLLKAAGAVGAKIIVLLLLFVTLMLLTGTTLIGLFRTIKKPVDVVQSAHRRREEEREILERETRIDIPLEPQLPAHPVRAETREIFPPQQKKSHKKKDNGSLEKLGKVFGFAEQYPDPSSEEYAPKAEPTRNEPAPALVTEAPAGADEPIVTEPALAQEPVPQAQPEVPATPVASSGEELSNGEPPQTDLFVEQTSAPAPAPSTENAAAHEEVARVTEEFMQKKAENDRREATPQQQFAYQSAEEFQYCTPPITMLAESPHGDPARETEELQTNGRILVDTLKSFGVEVKILDICRGPSVTRYEIQPAPGVKISKITNLSDDLALNLAATGVRIEAPIPGKAAVGIEVPNRIRSSVRMRDLVESNSFQTAKSKLSVALGRDIAGQPVVADLSKMPHLLIAGTTGSGKSVCINSLIISMLYKASPDEVRFLMIDPKAVELTGYNGMPHMLVPVVTDPKKASGALNWAVTEMMNRYKIFSECNVRNIQGYNDLAAMQDYQDENGQPMPFMPQIVIVIDELADLMMAAPKEVEDSICRLAQLARAAGMHLVVATQRPSVDVVTGLIKANIPSRIALTVSNAVDSRTILDAGGADKLLGNGDMLFAPVGMNKPVRVQGCYVSDGEISSIVEFVKTTKTLEYDENVIQEIERNAAGDNDKNDSRGDDSGSTDPMMEEAIKCVVEAGQASTSLLQRRLRLGYARAGRLIDEMEQLGVVGPHEGSKPRQVLMTYTQWLERNMQKPDSPDPAPTDEEF